MKDFLGYKDPYLSKKIIYNLMRLLCPLPCIMCDEIEAEEEGPFCSECYEKFTKLLNDVCPICGGNKDDCICEPVRGVSKLYFLLWYDKEICSDLILRAKYSGEKRYMYYLGKLVAENIMDKAQKVKFTAVCYVPRAKDNLRKYGIDQGKILAESVSFYLGLPMLDCIKRRGKSAEQKKLSGMERIKNVKNKFYIEYFELVDENGEIPSKILLIDDIVTTGSTVKECSYLLRKAGVRNVYVGAIAKTPLNKPKKGRYKRIK